MIVELTKVEFFGFLATAGKRTATGAAAWLLADRAALDRFVETFTVLVSFVSSQMFPVTSLLAVEPVESKRESHSFVESGCGADEGGVVRQPGDSWQEECNRCHCLASGRSGCTKQICGDLPSLGKYLL